MGAQVGTAFVDALKKTGLFAEVKQYDNIPDILRDVNTGRLKAGFGDYPILAYSSSRAAFRKFGWLVPTSQERGDPAPSRSGSARATKNC